MTLHYGNTSPNLLYMAKNEERYYDVNLQTVWNTTG